MASLDLESLDEHGWGLLPPSHTRCLKLQNVLQNDASEGNARRLDFVIVGRTNELMTEVPAKSLLVLTVAWEDGIAYNLGSKLVKERHWLVLE